VSGPALDARGVTEFVEEIWPGVTSWLTIEEVTDRGARVRMAASPDRLRPGGIVSGPVLMSLADTAVWAAVLGVIGPVVMTVTPDLSRSTV
jgi:acyl-coenzyme A thioesterase PaaI-like protein